MSSVRRLWWGGASVALLAWWTTAAAAQSTAAWVPEPVRNQTFQLSIKNIMRGPELVGEAPTNVRWTDDSQWVYFRWRPGGMAWDVEPSLYRVAAKGGAPEKLTDEQATEQAPLFARGDISPDKRWRVSAVDGDLWLVDRRTMKTRRLTHTQAGERSPIFSPDGKSVIYREGDNLFRMSLTDGSVEQLTHIESGPAPKEPPAPTGEAKFLHDQQLELFAHVRRIKAEEDKQKAEREAREAKEPKPLYLDKDERVASLEATRDGAHVFITTYTPAQNAKRPPIPVWVTADGFTQTIPGRTKVGEPQATSRIGLITTATGEVKWLSITPADYKAEGAPRPDNSGWNEAGTMGFVFSTSFNHKEWWLWSVNPADGALTLVDHLHDDAWVGGPCFARCVGFVPHTERIWYVSEATGYAHLYSVNADGTGRTALTSGKWEVLGVDVPDGQSRFLLTTNKGSPFNENTYWLPFTGGDLQPVTDGIGRYDATVSPDGKRFAILHDVANRPPELFLADAKKPMDMTRVTTSPTENWLSFPWIKPAIIQFMARDSTMVPASIYRPSDMGAQPNGAAVIFVHGAGYLHNVDNYWSNYYYREWMFNQFLAANGYTVLAIDYRGSAGYGRDWRTAIYEHMGGKDMTDQVDGAHWLVQHEGIDPRRIGMYGGSYGGFMTEMSMFTAGETFRAGAALRSVSDWAAYNDGYTSEILNLPQNDPEAYKRSSPIYFAQDLRPDQYLLILHGMVDTNVHFSDDVRLVQRLIELGKENWSFQPYPVENHGFVEPASWTDEYTRIFELFERTISKPGCTDNGGLCAVKRGGTH
ncbi:MAG: prolyl oligopeptidase family serine peptidase [Gemmatimonadetes bacterium]|nr:prolyl oligopeptidase family serine peptidase [Gemmatimonadota bacterium]